jgi:hypothetical protein
MPNKKITNPSGGNIPDEFSWLDEATPTVAAENEGTGDFDLSLELAEILASFSPPEPLDAQSQLTQNGIRPEEGASGQDEHGQNKKPASSTENTAQREYYRHLLHWRVAIVNKGGGKNDIYHGRTHDLSLHGVSILLEQNITFASEVVVLLAVPPINIGQRETILEITCNTKYTLLDSLHSQFRLEMKFVHFKGDGKKLLSDILSKRHIPKQELNPYASLKN